MAMTPEEIAKLSEKLEKSLASATDPKYRDALKMLSERLEKNAADAEAVATSYGALKRAQDELADSTKSLERSTERLIRSLTGVEQQADGVAAGILRMTKDLKDDGIPVTKAFGDALKTMGKTISKTITPMNVGISVFKKFSEASVVLTLEIDNASSAFAKATGTGNKYKDVIKAAESQNRRLGVSASESAAATSTLIGGFSEFLMIDGDLQKALVTEITQFEKFGVAAGTSAKFLQNVTRTTGRSIPAAQRLQKSIMGTANAFGDDLNKVMEESAEIMPKLAIHGQNLEGVFNNLYSASKRTGMGMSEIVSFAEQFDTFDSAAQAAGNLNAVLGQMGGAPMVDTMQILEETDPAKRMQLFSDAIQQSVGDFEQLGYYQQKAIANTMGMSVEETRRILLQEEQESALSAALSKRGLGEKEMLELQEQGRDLMTEMKILAMSFAVSLQGPLGYLKGFVGYLSDGLTKIREMAKEMDSWGLSGTILKGIAQLGAVAVVGGTLFVVLKSLALKGATRWTAMWVRNADQPPGAQTNTAGRMGNFAAPLAAAALAAATISHQMSKAEEEKAAGQEERASRRKTGAIIGGLVIGAAAIAAAIPTGGMSLAALPAVATAAGIGTAVGVGTGGMVGAATAPTGMATGGIVTKPTLSMTGERGPEAVVPLNAQGREGIGMTDNNKLLEANNNKLDELIAAVSNQRPVLIKSDLERAGFINKATKVTG